MFKRSSHPSVLDVDGDNSLFSSRQTSIDKMGNRLEIYRINGQIMRIQT